MKYLKVKPESDQNRISNKSTDFLVQNELFTLTQITKMGLSLSFIEKHFTEIQIPKNKTYYSFGARFSLETGYRNITILIK